MATITARTWNDTDIPAVAAADLAAALELWMARERAGLVLVGETRPATRHTIAAAVIGMSNHPAGGLAVLMRMRCLIEALSARRFRHMLRAEHAASLAHLVAIAAGQRLNPRWGMCPLRLAWAIAATATAADAGTRKAA